MSEQDSDQIQEASVGSDEMTGMETMDQAAKSLKDESTPRVDKAKQTLSKLLNFHFEPGATTAEVLSQLDDQDIQPNSLLCFMAYEHLNLGTLEKALKIWNSILEKIGQEHEALVTAWKKFYCSYLLDWNMPIGAGWKSPSNTLDEEIELTTGVFREGEDVVNTMIEKVKEIASGSGQDTSNNRLNKRRAFVPIETLIRLIFQITGQPDVKSDNALHVLYVYVKIERQLDHLKHAVREEEAYLQHCLEYPNSPRPIVQREKKTLHDGYIHLHLLEKLEDELIETRMEKATFEAIAKERLHTIEQTGINSDITTQGALAIDYSKAIHYMRSAALRIPPLEKQIREKRWYCSVV